MAALATGGDEIPVLIIEDEGKIARLLARALQAAGFAVTTSASGIRGLALAQNGTYRLVILDLMLPDIDGLSILDRLNEQELGVQVLVLSAVGDVHSKVRCLSAGACDYVTKPFDLAELVARVRLRVNEREEGQKVRYLRSGDFVLDLQKRTVTVGTNAIALSTREFVLLEHLMRRDGEVCSREQLLEDVWGYRFDPATNVLDVYVGRLRHKVGGGSIQTVRNVGYAFVGA
jgi:DNA-binding response OmpR family regulator